MKFYFDDKSFEIINFSFYNNTNKKYTLNKYNNYDSNDDCDDDDFDMKYLNVRMILIMMKWEVEQILKFYSKNISLKVWKNINLIQGFFDNLRVEMIEIMKNNKVIFDEKYYVIDYLKILLTFETEKWVKKIFVFCIKVLTNIYLCWVKISFIIYWKSFFQKKNLFYFFNK